MITGGCQCGAVRFAVEAPLRQVIACHCTQCRKTSGHYWTASSVPLAQFRFLNEAGLRWFRSSEMAQRGFCNGCGATLFWLPDGQGTMHFAPGALDVPSGLQIAEEWYLEDAGEYYTHPEAADVAGLTGSCLCGANQFTLAAAPKAITACHCQQCRRISGHFSASFDVAEAGLQWHRQHVTEYVGPAGSQRGFCGTCGSSLYFRAAGGAFAVEAGCLDRPSGGHLARHSFVAEKDDYYALTDGLPQYPAAAP